MHLANQAQNIVRLHGYVPANNAVGLVMEYLPNGNLHNLLINASIPIGAFLRLRMCSEVADGLSQIHNLRDVSCCDKMLVHGDMKTENVLLTDDLHCKISDFGSSKLVAPVTQSTITATQHANDFTPIYAPPELLLNPSMTLFPSVDAYSFSMILYFVLKRGYPVQINHLSCYLEAVKDGRLPQPVTDNRLYMECQENTQAEKVVNL